MVNKTSEDLEETEPNEEEKEEVEFKVENVVATATADIEGKLDLVNIARTIADSEYNPERFPGIVVRIQKPRATFLIFSTGKMVITGLEKDSDAEKAVKKITKKLKKAGIDLSKPTIKIQNIVASGDLHTFIDLNMAAIMMENIMFEPEIFPGLIYRMQDPRAVFLIFSTGKFVCTGVKDNESIAAAVEKLNDSIIQEGFTVRPQAEDYEEITFI